MTLRIAINATRRLRFDDGSPVRAASGVARFGDGWLVAQDDSTLAAWCRPSGVAELRVLPPVEGLDYFSPAAGTKHLKPDFEAAVDLDGDAPGAVLLLGSGSTSARMRAALVAEDAAAVSVVDLANLYAAVGDMLGIEPAEINLEGACVIGDRLRWFNRGNLRGGVPSASVELDVLALLAVFTGRGSLEKVIASLGGHLVYDLGVIKGVGLTITDAIALPEGQVLVSAAAEDTPNAFDDGRVVGAAMALLDGGEILAQGVFPLLSGAVQKVEGLSLVNANASAATVLAVVDDDDPALASAEHRLTVTWGAR